MEGTYPLKVLYAGWPQNKDFAGLSQDNQDDLAKALERVFSRGNEFKINPLKVFLSVTHLREKLSKAVKEKTAEEKETEQWDCAIIWVELPEDGTSGTDWEWVMDRWGLELVVDYSIDGTVPSSAHGCHSIKAEEAREDLFYPIPTLLLTTEKEELYKKPFAGKQYSTNPHFEDLCRRLALIPWVRLVKLPCNFCHLRKEWNIVCGWTKIRQNLRVVAIEDQGKELYDKANTIAHDCWLYKKSEITSKKNETGYFQELGVIDVDICEQDSKRLSWEENLANQVVQRVNQRGQSKQNSTERPEQARHGEQSKLDLLGVFVDINFDKFWKGVPQNQKQGRKGEELFNGLDILCRLKPVAESPDRESARRRYGEMRCPPLIVLTGYGDKEHIIASIHAGADDYVVKQMKSQSPGHHGNVNWKASTIHAFNTLFLLQARRLWLQWHLCRIAQSLQQYERKPWEALKQEKLHQNLQLLNDEMEQKFPTGAVPSFFLELHHITEILLKEFTNDSVVSDDPVSLRHSAQRIREALAVVPYEHHPQCKSCQCDCLFKCKKAQFEDVVAWLLGFFQRLHEHASQQIQKGVRRVPEL